MKKIFMFVNVDWFFFSHRQPIAKAAKKKNIDMHVFTEFTQVHNKKIIAGYNLFKSPLRRSSRSLFHIFLDFIRAYIVIKKGKPNLIQS